MRTFSSFSKASALRGTQPWMASPATAESHAGHPAATCSTSTYLWMFPSLKLRDSHPLELALPDSLNSLRVTPAESLLWFFFFFFFLVLLLLPLLLLFLSDSPVFLPESPTLPRNAPEWSIAGVTDTACLELTHPMEFGSEPAQSGRLSGPIQPPLSFTQKKNHSKRNVVFLFFFFFWFSFLLLCFAFSVCVFFFSLSFLLSGVVAGAAITGESGEWWEGVFNEKEDYNNYNYNIKKEKEKEKNK